MPLSPWYPTVHTDIISSERRQSLSTKAVNLLNNPKVQWVAIPGGHYKLDDIQDRWRQSPSFGKALNAMKTIASHESRRQRVSYTTLYKVVLICTDAGTPAGPIHADSLSPGFSMFQSLSGCQYPAEWVKPLSTFHEVKKKEAQFDTADERAEHLRRSKLQEMIAKYGLDWMQRPKQRLKCEMREGSAVCFDSTALYNMPSVPENKEARFTLQYFFKANEDCYQRSIEPIFNHLAIKSLAPSRKEMVALRQHRQEYNDIFERCLGCDARNAKVCKSCGARKCDSEQCPHKCDECPACRHCWFNQHTKTCSCGVKLCDSCQCHRCSPHEFAVADATHKSAWTSLARAATRAQWARHYFAMHKLTMAGDKVRSDGVVILAITAERERCATTITKYGCRDHCNKLFRTYVALEAHLCASHSDLIATQGQVRDRCLAERDLAQRWSVHDDIMDLVDLLEWLGFTVEVPGMREYLDSTHRTAAVPRRPKDLCSTLQAWFCAGCPPPFANVISDQIASTVPAIDKPKHRGTTESTESTESTEWWLAANVRDSTPVQLWLSHYQKDHLKAALGYTPDGRRGMNTPVNRFATLPDELINKIIVDYLLGTGWDLNVSKDLAAITRTAVTNIKWGTDILQRLNRRLSIVKQNIEWKTMEDREMDDGYRGSLSLYRFFRYEQTDSVKKIYIDSELMRWRREDADRVDCEHKDCFNCSNKGDLEGLAAHFFRNPNHLPENLWTNFRGEHRRFEFTQNTIWALLRPVHEERRIQHATSHGIVRCGQLYHFLGVCKPNLQFFYEWKTPDNAEKHQGQFIPSDRDTQLLALLGTMNTRPSPVVSFVPTIKHPKAMLKSLRRETLVVDEIFGYNQMELSKQMLDKMREAVQSIPSTWFSRGVLGTEQRCTCFLGPEGSNIEAHVDIKRGDKSIPVFLRAFIKAFVLSNLKVFEKAETTLATDFIESNKKSLFVPSCPRRSLLQRLEAGKVDIQVRQDAAEGTVHLDANFDLLVVVINVGSKAKQLKVFESGKKKKSTTTQVQISKSLRSTRRPIITTQAPGSIYISTPATAVHQVTVKKGKQWTQTGEPDWNGSDMSILFRMQSTETDRLHAERIFKRSTQKVLKEIATAVVDRSLSIPSLDDVTREVENLKVQQEDKDTGQGTGGAGPSAGPGAGTHHDGE